jgi:hypothetical protein
MTTDWIKTAVLSGLAIAFMFPATVAAQDADALAKQTQNPVASLISVPFQGNWDFGIGDREASSSLLNIQPVIPFEISDSNNIILRVIMPMTSQPTDGGERINGFGDVLASAFISPSAPGRIIWGVGPVFLVPTATSQSLGTEKFGIGPTALVLTQPGSWTIGALANHIWSVSGANDRPNLNQTFLQPFVNYNLGDGVAVGVNSESSANWEADDTWTVPVHFTLSKVTMLGRRPVNLVVGAGPMLASPTGSSWRFRMVATFLFPR